jgi:hypothetical protein
MLHGCIITFLCMMLYSSFLWFQRAQDHQIMSFDKKMLAFSVYFVCLAAMVRPGQTFRPVGLVQPQSGLSPSSGWFSLFLGRNKAWSGPVRSGTILPWPDELARVVRLVWINFSYNVCIMIRFHGELFKGSFPHSFMSSWSRYSPSLLALLSFPYSESLHNSCTQTRVLPGNAHHKGIRVDGIMQADTRHQISNRQGERFTQIWALVYKNKAN